MVEYHLNDNYMYFKWQTYFSCCRMAWSIYLTFMTWIC